MPCANAQTAAASIATAQSELQRFSSLKNVPDAKPSPLGSGHMAASDKRVTLPLLAQAWLRAGECLPVFCVSPVQTPLPMSMAVDNQSS